MLCFEEKNNKKKLATEYFAGLQLLYRMLTLWRPPLSYGYSYNASCVPDRVKPSIFDIRALWRSDLQYGNNNRCL